MRINEALEWGYRELVSSPSYSPRLDSEVILSHVLGRPATFVLAHDEQKISSIKHWLFKRLIKKRKTGYPVAYLTHNKEFYFLNFYVNKHVLIPRPDTEMLTEAVIEYISTLKNPILLDVGTGSGCIPIAVCKNVDGLTALATDVSRAAIRVACRNITAHRLKSRIKLFYSDVLDALPIEHLIGKDVVITANLPYVPSQMEIGSETSFEPHLALRGGDDGLDIYRRLLSELKPLKPKAIFVELFDFQTAILQAQMPEYKVKSIKPLTGKARMMWLEKAVD